MRASELNVKVVRPDDGRPLEGSICSAVAWDVKPTILTVLSIVSTGPGVHEPTYTWIENRAVLEALVATPGPGQVEDMLADAFMFWLDEIAAMLASDAG